MEVKTFAVAGAGQMGNGIAQVAAEAGFSVLMSDISMELAEKGKEAISRNLDRKVKKEKISEARKAETLDRIRLLDSLAGFSESDFVVEAATEKEALKLDIFKHLDEVCRPGIVLSTNTSSISITRIAAATSRPEKVIGMHFMNPVPVMKLVEVIKGLATDEETLQLTWSLAESMGKKPVEANDYPGFIANRILMPMINEAVYALMEGVGSVEAVDQVMKLGMNHPMGPLTLADLIGLDTCLSILEVLHQGLGDPKYRPCPLLVKYVDAGWLGKKTGRGFYSYESS
ncbi:MAG: 3-hydroxybutyryl-CoA dehydrogenase [bacterium]